MEIIKKLILILFVNLIFSATYPISQKPFIASSDSSIFLRGTYLIVFANSDMENLLSNPSLGNFVRFKKTQGFNVDLWDYENINSANALRDSLERYYEKNKLLEYVLLIGDYDPDSEISNPVIDSYTIPSYNELQDDVTDHPFTYFSGGPETKDGLNPKFFIGRWSVSSNSELINIIQKTIQYNTMEYIQDLDYYNRALLVAGSYKTLGANSVETLPHNWPVTPVWTSRWLEKELKQFGYSTIDTAFFYTGNLNSTNTTINSAWDNGVGIINYRGWGNAQGWVKPQFFISPDVSNLSYTYDLPVVFSFVCNTGDFGNDVEPVFGEALLRAGSYSQGGKGAVAMIGPSDLDTDTRFNNVMCGALWDGLLEGRTPELAQALHNAKQAVSKEFDGISETGLGGTQDIPNFYHHVYGVLGDPSLPVKLKTPTEIIVHDIDGSLVADTIYNNQSFISLKLLNNINDGIQDVVGALLYNNELIISEISTYEGFLDIDISNIDTIMIGSQFELYLNKAQYKQRKIIVVINNINEDSMPIHSYNGNIINNEGLYEVGDVEYNWIELNPAKGGNGNNLFLMDDMIAKDISLGFDFTYYGYTYSTINISSNGWAAFEQSDIPYFWNFSIPFPMGPYAMLAVFMDDLDDNGKEPYFDNNLNGVYDEGDGFITDCGTPNNPIEPYICHDYNQNGIRDEGEPFNVFILKDEENHRFIVQWDEVSNAEDDENCNIGDGCVKETFQLVLYNPSYQNTNGQGEIIYQYKTIYDIDDGRIGKNGNLSTIGIESPDQNQGVQYLFNGKLINGSSLQEGSLNGRAIQFYANKNIDSEDGTFLLNIAEDNIINKFNLLDVYPNPFNSSLNIRYFVNDFGKIEISIYNILGQKVSTIYKGEKFSGEYNFIWNANEYASGVYFITVNNENSILKKKILLLK